MNKKLKKIRLQFKFLTGLGQKMLHWSMILTIAKNLEIIPNHIQVKEKWVNAILLDAYVNYLIQLKMNVQKPVDQKIIKIGNIVKCNTLLTFLKKNP